MGLPMRKRDNETGSILEHAPGVLLGRSDLAGSGAAAASAGLPSLTSIASPSRVSTCNSLCELAALALVRAGRSGALALESERRGDQAGRWFHLRRKALHLAVYWAAAHPEQ